MRSRSEKGPKTPICFYLLFVFTSILVRNVYAQDAFHHPHLWEVFDRIRISPDQPREFKHQDLVRTIDKLGRKAGESLKIEVVGTSVEGRSISLLTLGTGEQRVFLWSQMHGDEPTATNALMDILNYFFTFSDEPFVRDILEGTTLYILPMLNPDGAERNQRRNAFDIDINRDARDLVSPEARILKRLRDEIVPHFGFNLHDQSTRRTVGTTNNLAAVALMAPPFDMENNDNTVRIRAKKVAVAILNSLSPYIYGHVSKYDAGYMPRSFGDAFQNWGTSTVLFETGGWYRADPVFMVRLNFIGILTALHAIATGEYERANPAVYDGLMQNERSMFDLLITDATVFDGVHPFVFQADIGIHFVQDKEGLVGKIVDIGDLNGFPGKDSLDAAQRLVMPGLIHPIHVEDPGRTGDPNVFLRSGVTTVAEIRSPGGMPDMLRVLNSERVWKEGLNVAFLLDLGDHVESGLIEHCGTGLSRGMLGLFQDRTGKTDSSPDDDSARVLQLKQLASWFNAPILMTSPYSERLPPGVFTWDVLKGLTHDRALELRIPQRGRIARNVFADLVIYDAGNFEISDTGIRLMRPHTVLVGGYRSWVDEKRQTEVFGRVVRRKTN